MKRLFVLVIVVGCSWLMYEYPHMMLNPGELTEAHQELNKKCAACHEPFGGITNEKCIVCHKLADIGKDSLRGVNESNVEEKVLFHQHLENEKCTSCHTDHKGLKPLNSLKNFDHALLPSSINTKCNTCHSKPLDNLHKQLSVDCNSCHTTKGWKLSVKFNHDMIQGVDKTNCTPCHQKPKDSYHELINDNCSKCHSTSKWVPSTFDHSAYFQLDRDHNTKCVTCHANNNFSTYTCYGCHEHSESRIANKHNEEGIGNFSNCVSCHKSANEHDIRMNGNSAEGEGREGKKENDDD